jgi:hypothetical protein
VHDPWGRENGAGAQHQVTQMTSGLYKPALALSGTGKMKFGRYMQTLRSTMGARS